MSEEKELLTILSEDEYKKVLAGLQKQFGKPKIQRRLSLQSDDYDQENVDTRIKITDGKAELIQKVGDWKNITKGKVREEISVPLAGKAQMILDLYGILRNIINGANRQNIVMQYENLIWQTADLEIKLTKQFGKNDAYNCEVEVSDNSLEPENLAKKYNIPINPPGHSQDFWIKWNEKVNLNADELSDEELLEIIKKYL